jgi:hypothetical protein
MLRNPLSVAEVVMVVARRQDTAGGEKPMLHPA